MDKISKGFVGRTMKERWNFREGERWRRDTDGD